MPHLANDTTQNFRKNCAIVFGITLALRDRDICAMGRASIDREELPRDEVNVEILRYVVAHPGAKDTISGIEKWWLSRSISQEGKRKIEESLNLLVSIDWMIGRCSPQSETIYSLNENSLPEIKEFLKSEP